MWDRVTGGRVMLAAAAAAAATNITIVHRRVFRLLYSQHWMHHLGSAVHYMQSAIIIVCYEL